jgi:hypothetical protein
MSHYRILRSQNFKLFQVLAHSAVPSAARVLDELPSTTRYFSDVGSSRSTACMCNAYFPWNRSERESVRRRMSKPER